jgi:alpha-ketoglutaric semialdehyde dehydrogenase
MTGESRSTSTVHELSHWVGRRLPGEPATERRNPANHDDVVTLTPRGDSEVVATAVEEARRAQSGWAALTPPARGAILLRAAELLLMRCNDIAVDLVREEGKTFPEARGEVVRAAELLQFYGGEGRRASGQVFPSSVPGTHVYTRREPLGVVGLITPWNFPIAIPTWKAAPALIAGNAVILKPAELTPLSTWHLAAALADAGLPPGIFNLVFGQGSAVGTPLVDHPDVAAISFTGSNAVGRALEQRLRSRQARVQLEMGGKNPLVVLDDADPATAAAIAAAGAFGLTGQACTATSRAICTEGIHDRLVEALIAEARRYAPRDGLQDGALMGPVVSQDQLEQDLRWIDVAQRDHAVVRTGGQSREKFLDPVVLTDVLPDHKVAQEEVFGPVLSVLRASDFDHAVQMANDTRYGLSAGVVTNSLRDAHRFAEAIQAGVVKINRPTGGVDLNVPFGGVKESSTNTFREQGRAALDFFSWTKAVYVGHS